jgi:hypothetical protein
MAVSELQNRVHQFNQSRVLRGDETIPGDCLLPAVNAADLLPDRLPHIELFELFRDFKDRNVLRIE